MIRPAIARFGRRLPSILAFALLAFQAAIPWTTQHFVTQDGPSHLYTGIVLKDLLLHRQSAYRVAYRLQPRIVPNWASAALLAAAAAIVGAAHAEQLLASVCVIAGFSAISYALAALYPRMPPWNPVTNFLLHNSFLSIGFYNFYLGMALFPLAIGYYVRHGERLNIRQALILSAGLVGLFFTHILAAALAAMTLVVIALWVHVILPFLSAPSGNVLWRRALGRMGLLAMALLPLVIFTAIFARASNQGMHFRPEAARAFNEFPMNLFITGSGRSGHQELLWPAVMFYVAAAAFVLRRQEWRTPKAALLLAAIVTLGLYFILPDDGFGGQDVKKRLAWGVFILGSLAACSAARLQPLRLAVSVYVACFLAAALTTSMRVDRAIGRATAEYMAAMKDIPRGAVFVRVYYPIPDISTQFGFEGVPLAPLFHADAYIAATRRLIDLSDYQAASELFPAVYSPVIDSTHRYSLWGLENSANKNSPNLRWLRDTLPVPIDYVVVIGEERSTEAQATDLTQTLRDLGSTMRLVSTARPDAFVRVYQRTGAR